MPSLSVVIPTFNNEAVVRRAVESWREAAERHDVEIVVVVDGDRDGTRAWLAELSGSTWGRRHLQWLALDNAHELRCTNAGFAVARGELLAAWQDDMFLSGRWMVPELLRVFARHRDIGLLSLSRGLNNAPTDAAIATWNDLVDWRRLQSTIGPRPWNWFRLQEVDGVVRPWVVRRECIQAVGPLDEAFVPTEWDETDLAYRIRTAGWLTATCGYERLGGYTHLGSSTLGELSDAYRQRVLKNGLLFHQRWDATIVREHVRRRRTWWRPQTADGWVNTIRGIAYAATAAYFPDSSGTGPDNDECGRTNAECQAKKGLPPVGSTNPKADERRLSRLASGPSESEGWQALGVGPQRREGK